MCCPQTGDVVEVKVLQRGTWGGRGAYEDFLRRTTVTIQSLIGDAMEESAPNLTHEASVVI